MPRPLPTVALMADTTLHADSLAALVAAVKDFAVAHEGTSATVEYVGKRGARIVLSAFDGASAEHVAPATDVAREVCREAGIAVLNTWEQELSDEIRAQAATW